MCAKEAAQLQAEDLLKLRAEIAAMAEIQEQSRDDQAHLQDTLQDTTADLHELQVSLHCSDARNQSNARSSFLKQQRCYPD